MILSQSFLKHDASLVAYYSFDDNSNTTLNDDGPNALTGTWQGTTTSIWAPGKYNTAGNFNGTDNYVDCGNGSAFNINSAVTIAGWFNPNATQTGNATPIGKGSAYWIEGDGGGLIKTQTFIHTVNPDQDNATGQVTLTAGVWNHLATTYDSATHIALTYVNGTLQDTTTFSGLIDYTIKTNTNNFYIANRQGFSREWKGLIDDVCLFNRALTAAEITYLSGTNPFIPVMIKPVQVSGMSAGVPSN